MSSPNSPPTPGRTPLGYWLPVVGWILTMLTFSSLPDPESVLGREVSAQDALLHASGFFVLALLVLRLAAFRAGRLALRPVLSALLFCALYGALDELHQAFIPGRSATWHDWASDVVGALVAGVLVLTAAGLRRR